MRAPSLRLRRIGVVLSGALLLAGFTTSGGPPPALTSAARCWVDGEAERALAALGATTPARERELNRAVVWLYGGDAAQAVSHLTTLHQREPRWTPALRWLARAQQQLGQPEVFDSAAALLGMPGADVRDQLWAGRLFLERPDLQRARAAFLGVVRNDQVIGLGWVGLAETEAQLGHAGAARVAGDRAAALGGAEAVPAAPAPASEVGPGHLLAPPGLHPGETLRYRVKYLFFNLASVTLETGHGIVYRGRAAHQVVFSARSNDAIPFFHMDSRFESVVGQDGAVLAHRHAASDSDSGDDEAGYDMDPEALRCTVRTVRDGLFGYDVLPLPPNAQDGISVLLVARALARARGSAVVPTVVDSIWWPTQLRTVGTERIRWHGQEVQTVRMQFVGRYRGPGGLSGAVDIWISDDERAVPYKVKMKVAVGSVVLELLPDQAAALAGTHGAEVS